MRRAFRKDANHNPVVDRIEACGWIVFDLSSYGAPVDLAISKAGVGAALVEIKDGSKPPSERKLTEDCASLLARWQGPFLVVTSPEDAERQLAQLEKGKT